MKEQDKIPTSRFQRAGKFINTGAKVGGNYIKYYGKRILSGEDDQDGLQRSNADDIYSALSNLKGGALKIAQMMSMDQGILPKQYTEKFAQAQYSAPPLSYPLVSKTFKQFFGKSPTELFDSFSKNAVAAASIGQVHQAEKDGKKLAVKVQYPGVADAINSDLRIVKPLVGTLFNISSRELDHYLDEVKGRLIEETDYELELKRSEEISTACSHLENLIFPKYFPELSATRVLTMEWLEGEHLDRFLQTNPSQEMRNKVGQGLWDFYQFQIHELKQLHADPHPGNFLIKEDGRIGVIDFGCVKVLGEDFYNAYFKLMEPGVSDDNAAFVSLLNELKFLLPTDSEKEKEYFVEIYAEMHELLARPFFQEEFDFADKAYFEIIFSQAERFSNDKILRKANAARGPRDAIYLNRTYFGLYTLLNQLGARVKTHIRSVRPDLV